MATPSDKNLIKTASSAADLATASTKKVVAASWKRCYDTYGLTPDKVPASNILTSRELRDVRDPLEDLLLAADPEMERLFSFLSVNNYIVTLTSTSGVTFKIPGQ